MSALGETVRSGADRRNASMPLRVFALELARRYGNERARALLEKVFSARELPCSPTPSICSRSDLEGE